MRLSAFERIQEMDPIQWNSLITDTNFFHTHWALSVLEKAKVEDAKVEYIGFYDNNTLIGSAVLNLFRIDLSLFIGDNAFIQWIKKAAPNFFMVKILFCGTPVSAGHKNLYLPDGPDREKCLELLEVHITGRCKKDRIQFSVFKEFTNDEIKSVAVILQKMNYFKGFSIPNTILDLPFESYPAYLNALKHGYRRQIKNSLRKIGAKLPSDLMDPGNETHFRIRPISKSDPEAFYMMYLSVMDRAKVKLETLNREFFTELFKDELDQLRSIELVNRNEVVGIFIVAHQKQDLIFFWTGKDHDKDELDTYQNLMQAMIEYAINSGCKRLILGQTSYYPKMKTGGEIEELHILFKCQKPIKHRILKSLSGVLFPQLKIDQIHAFKR